MLNAGDAIAEPLPSIVDWANPGVAHDMAHGRMNTGEDRILKNIKGSIRRGYPQMRTGPGQPEKICLVGSGPSLNSTFEELRQLVWEGAILLRIPLKKYSGCLLQKNWPVNSLI